MTGAVLKRTSTMKHCGSLTVQVGSVEQNNFNEMLPNIFVDKVT